VPWQDPVWYDFDKGTVNGRAPSVSGIYALKGIDGRWLYVGETDSIATSLLGHLAGDNRCITECGPATFSFEVRDAGERTARRDALLYEFLPLCNGRPE
jgi:hypothetical protein